MTLPASEQAYLKFWRENSSLDLPRQITIAQTTVVACPGVFNPDPRITRSCLHLVKSMISVRDKSVLDVGTGVGVLAIIAAMQGARSVVAIDPDALAIQCATANIRRHNLMDKIRVEQASFVPLQGVENYEVILANLPFLDNARPLVITYEIFLERVLPALDSGTVLQLAWASFGAVNNLEGLLADFSIDFKKQTCRWFGVEWMTYTCRRTVPQRPLSDQRIHRN